MRTNTTIQLFKYQNKCIYGDLYTIKIEYVKLLNISMLTNMHTL